jgi:hypothetical protein
VDRGMFEKWLDSYTKAWQGKDAAGLDALVADSFVWRMGPFAEVFRTRQGLLDYWKATVLTEADHEISHEIVGSRDDLVVARFRASVTRHCTQKWKDDVRFVVRLDADGRALEVREWARSERVD